MNTRKYEVPNELLDELLANYQKPEDLIGDRGLLKHLTKRLPSGRVLLDCKLACRVGMRISSGEDVCFWPEAELF